MLTVEEARDRILAQLVPLAPVELPLGDAIGAVAAADVVAGHALPRFPNSAMDGFAVRRADIAGASSENPIALEVVGEVRAGDPGSISISPGECVQIMTGAVVPSDTDAIVPVEDTEMTESKVWVRAEPPPAGHIRKAGEDVTAGEVVVRDGQELAAGEIALLASVGASPVTVRRAPRVAIVVTGDELVPPEEEPPPGRIRDSNTLALRALVEEAGGKPLIFTAVADELERVVETLDEAARSADLVVTAGGVSVGRYDFVKDAVERLGAIDLWRVAMQPGKPVVSGHVRGIPFLGLPGNPVSVHVSFEQFVRPAIRKLRGCATTLRPIVRAKLVTQLTKPPGRLHFVRVRLSVEGAGFVATPSGAQGSHIQSSLVGCHGVARFDAELERLDEGAEVEVEVWKLP